MATTLDNRHTLALPYWARPGFMLREAPADGGGNDGEDDENDDDEEDDEEDDPDEGKTPEQLRAELVALRSANSKSKRDATRNRARRKELETELAKAKDAPADEGKPEAGKYDQAALDKAVDRAKKAGFDEATSVSNKRIMASEARSALVAKGASPDKVKKLTALIDFDDLEMDDEGVIGLDDAIDELVSDWPELFAKRKVSKIGGRADRDDDRGKRPMTATERQVADLAKQRR